VLMNPITGRTRIRCSAITHFGLIAALLGLASEPGAQGQSVGPDAVATIYPGDVVVWGCKNGTQAYSTEGGVCNIGNAVLPGNYLDLSENHAMWTENLYRLANNRLCTDRAELGEARRLGQQSRALSNLWWAQFLSFSSMQRPGFVSGVLRHLRRMPEWLSDPAVWLPGPEVTNQPINWGMVRGQLLRCDGFRRRDRLPSSGSGGGPWAGLP